MRRNSGLGLRTATGRLSSISRWSGRSPAFRTLSVRNGDRVDHLQIRMAEILARCPKSRSRVQRCPDQPASLPLVEEEPLDQVPGRPGQDDGSAVVRNRGLEHAVHELPQVDAEGLGLVDHHEDELLPEQLLAFVLVRVGPDQVDRIAGVIKATHPDFEYQPLFPPDESGDAGRVRWVSGTPSKPPAYAGTDFIVARNGRIASVYLFFDNLP